ncbi:methylated-DNA--[protein]-cysteine S-methyltransferase [Streptomyces sp. NPDC059063]|uniref:methylated-DNA--[protein]-cysteine S-methyltransferase n=1 Tax=Streptomyces sp. NPDC059063 TaxID=3346712 RepID=UPI00367D8B1B
MYATTVPTPLGPFSLVIVDDEILTAGFTAEPTDLLAELPPRWRERRLRAHPSPEPYTSAITAYFDGAVRAIDGLPVVQPDSAFRRAAWWEMRGIRPGTTVSYRELAARAGRPRAARAAGAACAYNLIPLVVPCHRVRRTDGSLGGYYYGLDVKRWLLAHESGERPPLSSAPTAVAGQRDGVR